MRGSPSLQCRQRGASLIEALIAFLVVALGMVGIAKLQTHLRSAADLARQRSEALRLAQEEIESLRGFARLNTTPGVPAYDDIASTAPQWLAVQGPRDSARYRIERQIDDNAAPRLKTAIVSVSWDDRQGAPQRVELSSVIAGVNPALSAALSLAPGGQPVHGAFGRSAQIPLAAKDLGDGRSAFKPVIAGNAAWVFDNRSGRVTARCDGIAATQTTRELTLSDLTSCSAVNGVVLSGVVRFSTVSPPDAASANALPMALAVAVAGGPFAAAPACVSEAQKVVTYPSAAGTRRETAPLAATPASVGVASWAETGDRFVAYHCLLQPTAGAPRWSGRSTLVPSGWTLGASATQFKVCRFSADQDASGTVDHNGEHPDTYADVDTALPQQNFLVVKGDQACPAAPALTLSGAGVLVFANLGTVQHQP